jgi:plastocyanin
LLLAGALAIATGCTSKLTDMGGAPTGPRPAATITIVPGAFDKGMMAFSPDTVSVHVNDTVRLHNGDSIVHDIEPLTPGNPGWGTVSAGQDVDTQVTAAGTFTYVCAISGHAMVGRLIVAP